MISFKLHCRRFSRIKTCHMGYNRQLEYWTAAVLFWLQWGREEQERQSPGRSEGMVTSGRRHYQAAGSGWDGNVYSWHSCLWKMVCEQAINHSCCRGIFSKYHSKPLLLPLSKNYMNKLLKQSLSVSKILLKYLELCKQFFNQAILLTGGTDF